jgi:hypothetical protein
LAAGVAVLVLAATPPGVLGRPSRHGADLIVTRIKVDAGTPPYLVEEHDGTTQDFEATVTVKNVGDRSAGRSLTKVTLEGGPLSRVLGEAVYPVGRLAPGKSQRVTLSTSNIKVRLGLLKVYAKANYNLHVPERRYTNNRLLGAAIPVIARTWKVVNFSAHNLSTAGVYTVDDTERNQPGFYFKYDHFDTSRDRFVYGAWGAVTDNVSVRGNGCSGSGTKTTGHNPWSFPSDLEISYDLTEYLATLDTSAEPGFSYDITCEGLPLSWGSSFFNVLTYAGRPGPVSMSPLDKTLSGSGAIQNAFSTVTHAWHFEADVR